MAYITYNDYISITGDLSELRDFDRILALAEAAVDARTLYGYVGRDLSALPGYVAQRLRETVAFQAQYIVQQGGIAGANSADGDLGNVSLGKFSYALNASGRASGSRDTGADGIPFSDAAAVNIPLLRAYVNTIRRSADRS